MFKLKANLIKSGILFLILIYAQTSHAISIGDLEDARPSDIVPYGEIAQIINPMSEYTELQREDLLDRIKGKVVDWDLPVYEIKKAGKDKYRVITGSQNNTVGCVIMLTARSDEDKKYLLSLKTGSTISVKGVIGADTEFRHLVLNPAIINFAQIEMIAGKLSAGGKDQKIMIGDYYYYGAVQGKNPLEICHEGKPCQALAIIRGKKILSIFGAVDSTPVKEKFKFSACKTWESLFPVIELVSNKNKKEIFIIDEEQCKKIENEISKDSTIEIIYKNILIVDDDDSDPMIFPQILSYEIGSHNPANDRINKSKDDDIKKNKEEFIKYLEEDKDLV